MHRSFDRLDPGVPATTQLYGPNIVKLSNVDEECIANSQPETTTDRASIRGLMGYTTRFNGALTAGDRVIVPESAFNDARTSAEYLRQIGVSSLRNADILPLHMTGTMAQSVIATRERFIDALGKDPSMLVPFIHSRGTDAICRTLPLRTQTRYVPMEIVNNKALAMLELSARGVNVMPGTSVFSRHEVERAARSFDGKKGVIKLPRSASGHGQKQFTGGDELMALIDTEPFASHLLKDSYRTRGAGDKERMSPHNALGLRIEEWMENIESSPGIVVYIGENEREDRFISATDQLFHEIDGNKVHYGNIWPMESATRKTSETIRAAAEWVREIGGRGIVGIDLAIRRDPKGDSDVYVVELNGRDTGQTHGAFMVHSLLGTTIPEDRTWAVNNDNPVPIGTSLHEYVSHLERERIAYDPDGTIGVILANQATATSESKNQILLIAQCREQLLEMMQAARMEEKTPVSTSATLALHA